MDAADNINNVYEFELYSCPGYKCSTFVTYRWPMLGYMIMRMVNPWFCCATVLDLWGYWCM